MKWYDIVNRFFGSSPTTPEEQRIIDRFLEFKKKNPNKITVSLGTASVDGDSTKLDEHLKDENE